MKKTRSQSNSKLAFDQINNLSIDDKKKKQYGQLCHFFPILVLRSGLAQATGFFLAKAGDEEDSAHGIFLKHMSAVTNGSGDELPKNFQQRICAADLAEYQRMTRKILAASVWYKRFAESLLHVKAGEHDANG